MILGEHAHGEFDPDRPDRYGLALTDYSTALQTTAGILGRLQRLN
jgi:hypothetical protein